MGENTQMDAQNECLAEIQDYYGKSLTELVLMLANEPLVRHFKGGYYRVVSVGRDCTDGAIVVTYKPLMGQKDNFTWTRELLEFLSPVPEKSQSENVTGQKRRFELINDFRVQLDLVDTKDLLDELSRRENDVLRIDKSSVLEDEYAISRVLQGDDGKPYIEHVFNTYPTEKEAEDGLKRGIQAKRYKGDNFKIVRILYM